MAPLITPKDLPTWVPGRILSASDNQGWKDVAHRAYLYSGLDVPIPPMDCFMIVRYRAGLTPMDRCVEDRWTRKICEPGDFSLLTRSTQSHWHWTKCIDVAHTYLSEEIMSRVATDIVERDVAEVRLHDVLQAQDPVVTQITDTIALEAQHQGVGGALYAESLAIQLAVHLIRQYAEIDVRGNSPSGCIAPSVIRRIDEFVDAHLQEGVTIERLAELANLGVWTFTKHFRNSVGVSPYEYVIQRKIQRAVRMLTNSARPIKQIAVDCGFSDQAHLTRALKTREGVTPAQLRRSN